MYTFSCKRVKNNSLTFLIVKELLVKNTFYPSEEIMKRAQYLAIVALLGASGAHALGEKKGVQDAAQGLGTIAQGVQQIGQAAQTAAQQKTQKFMDAAGNVYDVLTDATGAATNFVMDAAGTVYDTTKLAGGFLFDAVKSYPGDVINSVQDSAENLRKFVGMGSDAASALGQFAMDARPELPSLKQMLKPDAWADAAKNSAMKMSGAFDGFEETLMDMVDQVESEYCSPAKFTPSVKKPASIQMPGFYIEAGLGECTVVNSTNSHKYNLDCTKPYVEQTHVPGKWTSKFHSAMKFKSKECKLEKTIGEADEIILFEFDGKTNYDPSALRDTVTNAFGSLTGSVQGVSDQLAQFMDGLKPGSLQGKLSQFQMPSSY
jgi:hypothetical protein